MRLKLMLVAMAALAACQSEVAIAQPEEAALKERPIVGATKKCKANPSPRCEFVLEGRVERQAGYMGAWSM